MDNFTKVQTAYNDWAPEYDSCANVVRDLDAKAFKAQVFELKQATVLELGSGTGRHSEYILASAGKDLTTFIGLEGSEGMLGLARERLASADLDPEVRAKATFVQHDLHDSWPIPDCSVDLIFENLVLEHLSELGGVFAEAQRVLKKGGTFFVSELHPYKQYEGGRAYYICEDGRRVEPPCHLHNVSEFVHLGLEHGMKIARLDEWWSDQDVLPDQQKKPLPRILTMRFVKE